MDTAEWQWFCLVAPHCTQNVGHFSHTARTVFLTLREMQWDLCKPRGFWKVLWNSWMWKGWMWKTERWGRFVPVTWCGSWPLCAQVWPAHWGGTDPVHPPRTHGSLRSLLQSGTVRKKQRQLLNQHDTATPKPSLTPALAAAASLWRSSLT